jgi:hypothetical protein
MSLTSLSVAEIAAVPMLPLISANCGSFVGSLVVPLFDEHAIEANINREMLATQYNFLLTLIIFFKSLVLLTLWCGVIFQK